ncbi:FG-GAP repeat protein [Streptomyces naganishii]|uniref:FG-GAP repeat protein n=1 Tax=Streptomyces naganishii TaxID=285447 RepID=UPI001E35697A
MPGSSAPGNHFGAATAWGDVNGDGYADLAIGAPGQDDAGRTDRGSVTVLYGPRPIFRNQPPPRHPGHRPAGHGTAPISRPVRPLR